MTNPKPIKTCERGGNTSDGNNRRTATRSNTRMRSEMEEVGKGEEGRRCKCAKMLAPSLPEAFLLLRLFAGVLSVHPLLTSFVSAPLSLQSAPCVRWRLHLPPLTPQPHKKRRRRGETERECHTKQVWCSSAHNSDVTLQHPLSIPSNAKEKQSRSLLSLSLSRLSLSDFRAA